MQNKPAFFEDHEIRRVYDDARDNRGLEAAPWNK